MPEMYSKKPVLADAVQFHAWQTEGGLEKIFDWLHAAYPFYVPQGYAHYLRQPHEKDRSRGDVLDEAYPYLVITVDGKRTRVDTRSWIVKYSEEEIAVFNETDFRELFDKVDVDK